MHTTNTLPAGTETSGRYSLARVRPRQDEAVVSTVVAGRSVDSGRTAGDVTIAAGVDYEIEHKGSVTLAPGFKVQKGASLSIKPSEY